MRRHPHLSPRRISRCMYSCGRRGDNTIDGQAICGPCLVRTSTDANGNIHITGGTGIHIGRGAFGPGATVHNGRDGTGVDWHAFARDLANRIGYTGQVNIDDHGTRYTRGGNGSTIGRDGTAHVGHRRPQDQDDPWVDDALKAPRPGGPDRRHPSMWMHPAEMQQRAVYRTGLRAWWQERKAVRAGNMNRAQSSAYWASQYQDYKTRRWSAADRLKMRGDVGPGPNEPGPDLRGNDFSW